MTSDKGNGFRLIVEVTDGDGNILEEIVLAVPANTIERAATRVIDALLERFIEYRAPA